jgi:hypothetical protein
MWHRTVIAVYCIAARPSPSCSHILTPQSTQEVRLSRRSWLRYDSGCERIPSMSARARARVLAQRLGLQLTRCWRGARGGANIVVISRREMSHARVICDGPCRVPQARVRGGRCRRRGATLCAVPVVWSRRAGTATTDVWVCSPCPRAGACVVSLVTTS